jgi:hypothetical protein
MTVPPISRVFAVQLAVLGLFLTPALATASGLRAAVSRIDLEIPEGETMWGYTPRPNQGVLDPLRASIFLFSGKGPDHGDAGQSVALVTLDLGRTPAKPQMDRVRDSVRSRSFVDDVFFTASHTHSGPYFHDKYPDDVVPQWELDMVDAIADEIVRLSGETFEASIGVGYGRAEIGFNRRYVLPDGSVRMLWANPGKVSTYPVDPEVTVVRIDDGAGRTRGLLVAYSCHPVVFGPDNLLYSADFPGAMARLVEAEHPDSPITAFAQGAPGDINPFLDKRELEGDAVALMRQVGTELGREVLEVAQRTPVFELGSATSSNSGAPGVRFVRESWQFTHRLDANDPYQGDLTVLMLGSDIAFVGLPGEPFVEFQLDLKRRKLVEHSIFLGYTNGYVAYFPTIRAAAEGGYGADPVVARVDLGAGERMMMRAYRAIARFTGRLAAQPRTTPSR